MRLALLAAAAFCVYSLSAHADTFKFVVEPQSSTDTVFTINSAAFVGNRTIASDGYFFEDYSAQNGGGFNLDEPAHTLGLFGPAIYGSSFSDIIAGTYHFSDNPNNGVNDYTAVITDLGSTSSVTPEASSIVLLGSGLLGVAGVVRKRFA